MNKWIKYVLIVLEVGGGFMGIWVLLVSLKENMGIPAYGWIFPILSGAMFLFGIVAGLAFMERLQLGIAMSAVYQAFQIPILSSPLLTYKFYSGLQIGVGWKEGLFSGLNSGPVVRSSY